MTPRLLCAVLLLRIGNPDQGDVAFLRCIGRQCQWREIARTVHSQQCKPAVRILGDPVGVTQTRGDNDLASACEAVVSHDVTLAADD